MLQYYEDDPLLSLTNDLYLRDVDSNITSASLHFNDLMNGLDDYFFLNQTLALTYGLNINTTMDNFDTRTILVSGTATPDAYKEVLNCL